MSVDLHAHSTFSDGTLTPGQLLELAGKKGLSAVVLSDHNTVAGLADFLKAGDSGAVEAVPGIEFSTEYNGKELHILALFVMPEHYDRISQLVGQMLLAKDESYRALCSRLAAAGILVDYDSIKNAASGGTVNRAIIGAQMVRDGYCASVKEAFSQWLSPKWGFYVPPRRLDALEVIRFIDSVGAVSVLAHPFLSLEKEDLPDFLKQAVGAGLDAMEVFYSTFDETETALAGKYAEEYGLLKSGGSDFHGDNKPDIELGTGKGNLNISDDLLEGIRGRFLDKRGKR